MLRWESERETHTLRVSTKTQLGLKRDFFKLIEREAGSIHAQANLIFTHRLHAKQPAAVA